MTGRTSAVLDDATKFIEERLKDTEYGGYFPVVDCEGKINVSTDKRLVDQTTAALLYVEKGDLNAAQFAIQAMERLYDSENGGFTELTDRYWNPHGVGKARTLHVQFDAARAFALYAAASGERGYLDRALGLLEKVDTLAAGGRLAGVYSEDWKVPLDYEPTASLDIAATNLAAAFRHLGLSAETDTLAPFIERLAGRIGEDAGEFYPREFYSCDIRANAVLAIANWASANDDSVLLGRAGEFLNRTIERYRDARYGGFWNRTSIHGQVKVDWQVSYRRNESPFPIKKTLDAALLMRAAEECGRKDGELERELSDAILHFHDSVSGGFFLGMGYFWSTPEDPTVPFARQFWAAGRDPGVFSIGNLTYLPLHLKTLETQAACARIAIEPSDRRVRADTASAGILQEYALEGSFREAHTDGAPVLPVDVDGYLGWLNRARTSASSPYGLTAEISPLGFRADRSWQVFSALHVLGDLRALDIPIASAGELVKSIRECQNPDGGFSEQPGQLSDIFATYCATVSLRLLNSEPALPSDCIAYVERCRNTDGGYGNVPGLRSDIWHTNLAVLSLHALGVEPELKEEVADFAVSCRTSGGGFSNMPNLPPDTFSTYRAVSTLAILGKGLADAKITVEWLRALQDPGGPFLYRPGHACSLVGTYMAIASLYLLDSEPPFVEAARNWIASHQKDDGGFGPLGTTSATTDESFTCIQTLLILQRSLTKYWVAVVN